MHVVCEESHLFGPHISGFVKYYGVTVNQWRPPNVCKYFFLFSFSFFFCYELNSNFTTMAAIVRAHEQHGPLARPRKIKTGLKGKVVTQSLWTCTCMVDLVLRHWQLETARANTGSLTSLSQKHARRVFLLHIHVCYWFVGGLYLGWYILGYWCFALVRKWWRNKKKWWRWHTSISKCPM